ncbi:SDR family oxidoreductase [Haematospirillum sp. 15-248]|uniref:SDR family oxidoreductase n=1 Tax=Haematospirillum sp. 15-248 TaxID=2723107 RepID=UPI00143ABABD|nr:SDR family oxidoreductase [Haematospirillum sp. 15-248]NKD88412.1 SDR family oxidoreductase [Haematospirillum sp. 15-248]
MPTLLCSGFGFCAAALASRLLEEGWTVRGTTRHPEKAGALRAAGIETWIFDGQSPMPAEALDGVTHILVSAAPKEHDGKIIDPVLDCHREQLRQAAEAGTLRWVGYLSSTGVYGDHQGAVVTEDTPVSGNGSGSTPSTARIEAEQQWLEQGGPIHIFRLSGIYGPGRSALDSVRSGRAQRIVKPGHVFCRIHVDDIATVLRTSALRPNPGRIYNVADDEPAPYADVVTWACTLLGVTPPPEIPWEQAQLSPMSAGFYNACRRVDNTRIKEELGITLAFPTYRDGLRSILEFEQINRQAAQQLQPAGT